MRMHVSLKVADLESNLTFYKAFFGAEPTKVKANYAKFELNEPPLHFSMVTRPKGEDRGVLDHFGIQVDGTEAVLAARERLKTAGLTPLDEMGTTCCYAVSDKVWIHDPEGNAWEIFYTKADSEFESADDPAVQGACCAPEAPMLIGLEELK